MFGFIFRKKTRQEKNNENQVSQHEVQQSPLDSIPDRYIFTLSLSPSELEGLRSRIPFDPALITGFVSQDLPFQDVTNQIARQMDSSCKFLFGTTAGELCSIDGDRPLAELYSRATPGE